jgi:hypothetical protein
MRRESSVRERPPAIVPEQDRPFKRKGSMIKERQKSVVKSPEGDRPGERQAVADPGPPIDPGTPLSPLPSPL